MLIDSVVRFIPGVIGHPEGALQDSFEHGGFEGPQYTRPEVFENVQVPQVLTNGIHKLIEDYREKEARMKLRKVRPDLYEKELLKKVKLQNRIIKGEKK